ncbi:MAG: xanthine dehydrogenase family protein molybdopterin-binding subunit [Acidobacteriia bacterium]|nr:xanthine dehydrogenase family protein molybdopterin-binding subunit [Terriglobia bacterium]
MKTTRRDFLKVTGAAGAGLVIGFHLPSSLQAAPNDPAAFEPNVWLQIDPAGKVTITCAKSEMGQGVRTSLPMIVAEELDADFAHVAVKQAMGDPKYGQQLTGGSTSVRTSLEKLRKAGATARAMLVAAAAKEWSVDAGACHTDKGFVTGPGGKRASYGSLAAAAAKLPVPKNVKLKDPKDFKIIGQPLPRTDLGEKVSGKAQFGIDVRLPGMLVANIARCPVFGGKVAKFDAAKAKAVPGVKHVVQVSSGVAVVGDSYWSAHKGREALEITWDEGPHARMNSADISQRFAELAKGEANVGEKHGDAGSALSQAAQKIEATYEVPFLAHATMEPMNCAASVKGNDIEVWAPTQFPENLREQGSSLLDVKPEQIKVHVTFLGGGFGRRAESDYALDALAVSKAISAPVKVVWSREDDMQHDWYRPASYHVLSGGLDAKGKLVAWKHRVVAPSIGGQRGWVKPGALDKDALDAAVELRYSIPNLLVDYVMANTGVPAGWWRSVYASQNALATESFIDELAAAAKTDPLEFRLAIANPRAAGVLKLAAEKAGWGKPAGGRAQGIAMAFSFGTYVAHVAEVSLEHGIPRLRRVVAAVDCGMYVNPAIIEAQIMSAVVFGLSGMRSAITVQNGRAQQSNFHDFEVPRLNDVPNVEVHLVKSGEKPGGIGEPGLPPLAPAVLNAMAAATGKRVRKLPLSA